MRTRSLLTLVAAPVAAVAPFVSGAATIGDTGTVIAIYALIALSVGVTYGMSGLLSVAQASFAAIGAYITAILTSAYDWSPWLTLPLASLLPAAFAYPFARAVTRLSPLALAVATLMFGYIFDIAVREAGSVTGGYIGLSGIPPLPGFESNLAYYLLSWGFVLLAMALYASMRASHIGTALRTIRADELRAAADGVDVAHLRRLAMSVGAAFAGVAGWLYAHHLSYVGPDSLNPMLSLSALLMAVVGGARNILGPVLGAVLLTLMLKVVPAQESLGMFYGGALILCLLVAPEGIAGLAEQLARWRRKRGTEEPSLAPAVGKAPVNGGAR